MEPQPIETAPKDGTKILLWGRCEWEDYGADGDAPEWRVGHWEGVQRGYCPTGWVCETSNPYHDNIHATHWMPLHAPPQEHPAS